MLKKVEQYHDLGCFVACVSMILNKPYFKTLKLIHPDKKAGKGSSKKIDVSVDEDDVPLILNQFGVRLKKTSTKKISDLKRDALLIVRLKSAKYPGICLHSIIYDASNKKILDPDSHAGTISIERYERALDTAYYIG